MSVYIFFWGPFLAFLDLLGAITLPKQAASGRPGTRPNGPVCWSDQFGDLTFWIFYTTVKKKVFFLFQNVVIRHFPPQFFFIRQNLSPTLSSTIRWYPFWPFWPFLAVLAVLVELFFIFFFIFCISEKTTAGSVDFTCLIRPLDHGENAWDRLTDRQTNRIPQI